MKFKLKSVPLALGLCLMSGAALAQQAEEVAKPVVLPPPPAGKAEVVFFRMSGFMGSAISCAIQENGAKIASLPPGRFFVLVADAGRHAYTTASSKEDNGIFFDLKPGDIKYVGCNIIPGAWSGHADLEIPIRDDAFATKMWKQVTPDRIVSPNVLSAAQLAASMTASSAATVPTPASAPVAAPVALAVASAPAPAPAAPATPAPVAAPAPAPALAASAPAAK